MIVGQQPPGNGIDDKPRTDDGRGTTTAPSSPREVGGIIDLSREGPIDQCTELLAAKIVAPSFWVGAEHFVGQHPPSGGHEGVRAALARHIRHLFGVTVRWEQLLLVPNECVALELFVHTCCSPGDVLLCPAPFADPELPVALSSATLTKVELLPVQLEDAPELSIADLQAAMERMERKGRRVRALLLHNPHPILSWIGDGQRRLVHILEWATEREIFLLVDESLAAMDLWEFSSCLGLDHRGGGLGQWLVWIWSGAKHFSLPGLAFSALLLPRPDLIHSALPFLQLHSCAPLVQYLAAKLLEDFDWTSELFARRKSRLEELRRNIMEGLTDLGLMRTLVASEEPIPWIMTNLKTFLDDFSFEAEQTLREEFARKASLRLTSGEQLGMADPGWFRIRVASSGDRVGDVLGRLKMVLAGRKGSVVEGERMDLRGGTTAEIPWGSEEEQRMGEPNSGEKVEQRSEGEEMGNIEVGKWSSEIGRKEKEDEHKKMEELKDEEYDHTLNSSIFREEVRRMSLVRDEEKYGGSEDERNVEMKEMDWEEDEIIREVFAIFPQERLRWKEPLAELERNSTRGPPDEWAEEKDEKLKRGNEEREAKKEEKGEWKKTSVAEAGAVGSRCSSSAEVAHMDEEDVRNGLDVASLEEEEGLPKGERIQPQGPTTSTAPLTDLSFIEQLVREEVTVMGEEAKREGHGGEEGEYYDEASTEEEEEEETKKDDGKEEGTAGAAGGGDGRQHQPPRDGREGDGHDEEESKRIIEIIDQIFHEAVQIRDYSADVPSSNVTSVGGETNHNNRPLGHNHHPAGHHLVSDAEHEDFYQQQNKHQQQQLWSRSDSGLAAESPPTDFSVSPIVSEQQGHHLYSIAERSTSTTMGAANSSRTDDDYHYHHHYHSSPEFMRDDTIQSGDSAFLSNCSPQTSTLGRRAENWLTEMEEEHQRYRGPTTQMLDDSGIFIDFPPGSLCVDFPLLVPTEQLRAQPQWASAGEKEFEWDKGEGGRKLIEEDLWRMETDHHQQKTTVLIRDEAEEEEGRGWSPLEDVEPGPIQLVVETEQGEWWPRGGGTEEEEEGDALILQEQQRRQQLLASALNEGATFCPPKSPKGNEISVVEVDEKVSRFPWKPLDQLEELELKEERMKTNQPERDGAVAEDRKKFSDELDELEARSSGDDKGKSEVGRRGKEVLDEGRRRSRMMMKGTESVEAMDVVAQWNARVAERARKSEAPGDEKQQPQQQQQQVDVDLHFTDGRRGREGHSAEVHWKGIESDALGRTVVQVEEEEPPPEAREEALLNSSSTSKIEVNGSEGEKHQREREEVNLKKEQWHETMNLSEDHSEADIPGRSRYFQIHQRMQMGRRLADREGRRCRSRDAITLEHMNITELEYRRREGTAQRLEKGERILTSISTRINQWAPDEWFSELPLGECREGRERMTKLVEARRRRHRSYSMPSTSSKEREGDVSEKVESEYTLIRRIGTAEDQQEGTHERNKEMPMHTNGDEQYLACRNPTHFTRTDHCDPWRRRSTRMRESEYKKMKREREGREQRSSSGDEQPQLHSEFETEHFGWTEQPLEGGGAPVKSKFRTRHKYKKPRRAEGHHPKTPSRITVTTSLGRETSPEGTGASIDRVTVRHTPGSRWIVSSVYRSTDWGWEKTSLKT